MAIFDWKAFEEALAQAAGIALRKLMDKHSQTFYAGAFHEFYAEWNDQIALPCLAANTVEALSGSGDSKWSSADWKWIQIPYQAEIRGLHRQLQKDSTSQDAEHWERMYNRFIQAFVNVAKRLTKEFKEHSRADREFAFFVFVEEENEVEILRKCTTPAQFKKLFPHLHEELGDAKKLSQSSTSEKSKRYREDLFKHRDAVAKLGTEAIPLLLDALDDGENSRLVAEILVKIGVAEDRVLEALRRKVKRGAETDYDCARALAVLGDVDFLMAQTKIPSSREAAITGITYLCYVAPEDAGGRTIPLDYRPVEQLLEDPDCKKFVKLDGLRIGRISDLEEILRGVDSKHAVIRSHAVFCLGERSLGKKASERILPAIAACLEDRSATVRRRAVIALSYWKKAAKPYAAAVRKRFKDSNWRVVDAAKHYITDIT